MDLKLELSSTLLLVTIWYTCQRVNNRHALCTRGHHHYTPQTQLNLMTPA